MDSYRLTLRAVVLVLSLAAPALAAPPEDGPVVVTLRPTAAAAGPQVLVQHVATVTGGTAALRRQIAKLDLADAPRRGGSLHLVRDLLVYRIQLAGIDRGRFRVEGPARVTVQQASGPLTEDDFVAAARDAILEHLPHDAEDVIFTLTQPLHLPEASYGAADEVRLDAAARQPLYLPGRARVDVTLLVNGRRQDVVPVPLEVKVVQPVAVAERALEAGETLSSANVRFERRTIDAANSYVTAKEVQAGRRVKKPLAPGQVLMHSAVEPLAPDNPVLVKQRDLVKVLARVGKLRVTAMAEAQQDGRRGERIRVRNVDSKKELVGRVIERGMVEIDF
jgi:flagella basal body P-ring formation protein FlgA